MLLQWHELPAEDDPGYQKAEAFMVWYVGKWLRAVAGDGSFGKFIKYYKLPVEKVVQYGKKRCYVTGQSEAFGLLMLENNYDKWSYLIPKTIQAQKEGKPTKYNKNDPSTHWCSPKKLNDLTKYSDSAGGQGKGWNQAGHNALIEYEEKVKEMRQNDAANGFVKYNKAKTLLRAADRITEASPATRGKRHLPPPPEMKERLEEAAKKKARKIEDEDYSEALKKLGVGSDTVVARPPPRRTSRRRPSSPTNYAEDEDEE